MVADQNKDISKTVKFDEAIHSYLMDKMAPFPKVKFSDLVRASIAWSGDIFIASPWRWGFVLERWLSHNSLKGELVIKPFRLSEPFDRWARQLAHDLSADFTSLTIRSILLYLPAFQDDPESVGIIYQRWLEEQSVRCITKPVQLEMRRAK